MNSNKYLTDPMFIKAHELALAFKAFCLENNFPSHSIIDGVAFDVDWHIKNQQIINDEIKSVLSRQLGDKRVCPNCAQGFQPNDRTYLEGLQYFKKIK